MSQERSQYTLSTPEPHQQRIPSSLTAAAPPSPATYNGRTFDHLPSDLAQRLAVLLPLSSTRQHSTTTTTTLAAPSASFYTSLPDHLARQVATLTPLSVPPRRYSRSLAIPPPPAPATAGPPTPSAHSLTSAQCRLLLLFN